MTVNKHLEEYKAQFAADKKAKAKALKEEASRFKKALNAKKKNSLKPRLSETLTFGLIIPDEKTKHYSGFIYRITLTHPRAPGVTYSYIGKKSFKSKADWHYYMSSGAKVMEKLNYGWEPHYEVISLEGTERDLSRAEAAQIVSQWLKSEVRAFNLNMAVVLSGVKWTRYKYCKHFLKVIDKTY